MYMKKNVYVGSSIPTDLYKVLLLINCSLNNFIFNFITLFIHLFTKQTLLPNLCIAKLCMNHLEYLSI